MCSVCANAVQCAAFEQRLLSVCTAFAHCLRSVCALFAQRLRNVCALLRNVSAEFANAKVFAHGLRNVCAKSAQSLRRGHTFKLLGAWAYNFDIEAPNKTFDIEDLRYRVRFIHLQYFDIED